MSAGKKGWGYLTAFILLMACFAIKLNGQSPEGKKQNRELSINDDNFFEGLFKKYPGKFDSVLAHRQDWKVQIIYTEISRGANGMAALKDRVFNSSADYFYPASAIKLPVVLLALQKLSELKAYGIDKNTTMITESSYSGQTPVYNDPNTADGRPTIAQYIKKILMASDNDAYNRLYEFLGQEYINKELSAKGYTDAQVIHRLGVNLNEDENRHTNPVNFYNNGHIIYSQPAQYNVKQYPQRSDSLGKGYYQDGMLINAPMDFSKKNRMLLADLHEILTGIIFPEKLNASRRFNISEEDRKFVLQYMSQLPGESVFPFYDTAQYNNASGKLILYGSDAKNIKKNIRIFNKEGDAYGQLTDVAYIVDFANKIEFMVSATIYCNSNGILNDDQYNYNDIGLPFMKDLGNALYDYELKRKRNIVPDLSSFLFSYDK